MSGQLRSGPETLGQVSGRPGSGSVRLGPPLATGQLIRQWEISELRGHGLEQVIVDEGMEVEGLVHRLHDFPGGAFNDVSIVRPDRSLLPPDGIATGQITSFADGITYWVCADAPLFVEVEAPLLIGSRCWLRQTQSFSKLEQDASLSFTITSAFIETTDLNDPDRGCPPEVGDDGPFCDVLKGELHLDVHAFTVPAFDPADPDTQRFGTFFRVAGGATGGGFHEHWGSRIWTDSKSQFRLWDEEPRSTAGTGIDFDFILDEAIPGEPQIPPHSRWLISLRHPRTFTIDLSSLDIGQAFTLQTVAVATAYNRIFLYRTPLIEFESSASAGLIDPLGIGGTEIAFSGLEPIEVPGITFGEGGEGGIVLIDFPVEPAPCPPGSPGNAGSLQFSADHYTITESNPTPLITVIRSGGTTGAVTATITTSDGTALAGTDYTPVHTSVHFADGDNTPRAVVVPVLPNEVGGQVDRTVTITLSDPGGCATLGSPSTTELTIRDDDPAPPAPTPVQPYGLDPAWGTGGKATTTAFGGDRSAMALQPDGKVVMVGGTFTAFVLARFDVHGNLDNSFGTDGLVTTNIGGGFSQEEALGVAIQPDDMIVVAGYSNRDDVTVARYRPDGQLDDTFGTAGVVTGIAVGIANDVTIHPDGGIVIAGRASVAAPQGDDFDDLFVARLLDNGGPDLSFGLGGQVVTNVGELNNQAENVVVQPADGMIVVSGSSRNPGGSGVGIDHHTDIVRYRLDGQPDPDFGNGGTLTLDAFVGADLAIQPDDGRLLLVGTADTTPSGSPPGSVTELSVMRLEPNGTPDLTFGDNGTANVSVTALTSVTGDPGRDTGAALALQPDGRIVIAGATGGPNANFAVARLLPDGTLDTEFTDTGVMTIDFFGFTDLGESVAVTDDGNILVSGLARDNVDGYGVARLSPQDTGPTDS
jgi:uncharacterized delta-60 repeat protein